MGRLCVGLKGLILQGAKGVEGLSGVHTTLQQLAGVGRCSLGWHANHHRISQWQAVAV